MTLGIGVAVGGVYFLIRWLRQRKKSVLPLLDFARPTYVQKPNINRSLSPQELDSRNKASRILGQDLELDASQVSTFSTYGSQKTYEISAVELEGIEVTTMR